MPFLLAHLPLLSASHYRESFSSAQPLQPFTYDQTGASTYGGLIDSTDRHGLENQRLSENMGSLSLGPAGHDGVNYHYEQPHAPEAVNGFAGLTPDAANRLLLKYWINLPQNVQVAKWPQLSNSQRKYLRAEGHGYKNHRTIEGKLVRAKLRDRGSLNSDSPTSSVYSDRGSLNSDSPTSSVYSGRENRESLNSDSPTPSDYSEHSVFLHSLAEDSADGPVFLHSLAEDTVDGPVDLTDGGSLSTPGQRNLSGNGLGGPKKKFLSKKLKRALSFSGSFLQTRRADSKSASAQWLPSEDEQMRLYNLDLIRGFFEKNGWTRADNGYTITSGGRVFTNQCFYLSVARSYLCSGEHNYNINLPMQALKIKEDIRRRGQVDIGDNSPAMADDLHLAMSSTDGADQFHMRRWAVAVFESQHGSVQIVTGPDYVEGDAGSRLIFLWCKPETGTTPGHYQAILTETGSTPTMTAKKLEVELEAAGLNVISWSL